MWMPRPADLGRDLSDRYAASLINARIRGLYYNSRFHRSVPGIIFAPNVSLFCAYPSGSNSNSKRCNVTGGGPYSSYIDAGYSTLQLDLVPERASCVPGCFPDGMQCGETRAPHRGCSYPPSRLCETLQTWEEVQAGAHFESEFNHLYTEIIVDARSVVNDPVAAIDGFFLMTLASPSANSATRKAHAGFIRKYGLDSAAGPPLVLLELGAEQPFSLAS